MGSGRESGGGERWEIRVGMISLMKKNSCIFSCWNIDAVMFDSF